MTAVLEKLIYEEVCPREVVDWLMQKDPNGKRTTLTALNSLRGSFVQFFINHLRSQTAQLTFHGQTTFASPAGKANKLFKALQQQTSKLVQTPTTASSHRTKVNLFQSPASTDFSDVSLLETSNSSIDTSGSFLDSSRQTEDIKHGSNRSFSSLEGDLHSTKSFEKHSNPMSAKMDRRSRKARSYGMQKTGVNKSRSKSNHGNVSNTAHDFSIDSLKDFPSISSSKGGTSTPRRITPTAVSTPLHTSSVHSSFGDELSSPWIPDTSPGNFGSGRNHSGKASLEDERDLLKMMKADKIKQISLSQRFSPQSPSEKAAKFSLVAADAVIPEMNKVTFMEQLKALIQLYSIMLEELLIPNVWMELYFLIQLLTVKGTVGEARCHNYCYLTTVHNAVYFAVEVLSKLTRYLAMLDKPTLNLLCENDTIQKFKPPFHNRLMVLWDRTSLSLSSSSKPSSILASVPFHVETDNRENFPSDKSFHCFKKQRDKFYELLREWQVQHTIPGWSMHVTMATRIRELISMATDITNTYHFAKLFTSQLIKMCLEDQDQIASLHENFLLNHLKLENPDKLKRLEERFTTPSSVVGPCPPPQFQGCQEFFRSFIVEADSFTFNQHVMDCISARIQELNKFSYLPEQGNTSSGNLPDKELKDQFIACLQTMQILAKFLGFIKFLPYKQTERVSEKLKEEIIAGRPKEPHQLDVLSSLQSGYHHQRLVLTVPWLVEYLSMMDADATTLEYYQKTFKLLSFVYRVIGTSGSGQIPPCNQFLLLLHIGWLFEVQSHSPDLLQPLDTVQIVQSNDFREPPLDHIPFIDKKFLYSSCPYLSDVRSLLSESTNSSPMRKITPIAADATASPNSYTTEFNISQVQVDLERNFFHTQSPSLKKSVDFVGSRVASNCIKYIDSNLLMNRRKSLADQMMALFHNASTADGDMQEFRKNAQECMDQACRKTVEEAEETGKRFVERKCQVLIRNMIAEDASVQLKQTACSIAVRNSLQKFQRWIHLQIPGAFRQELESTLQKCLKLQTTKVGHHLSEVNPRSDSITDAPPAIGPSCLLQELKDAVYTVIISPDPSQLGQDLHELISKTKAVLCGRKDLTPTSLFAIEHLLKDLFALTCMIHPRCVTNPSVAVEPFKELTDKLNNVIISPSDNHSDKGSKTVRCPVGGCPFSAMTLPNISDDMPCLIHEFLSLCKDCFSSRLSHKHFMSARREHIGAVSSSVMADKDFCKIYDYMKEIQLIEDEVT